MQIIRVLCVGVFFFAMASRVLAGGDDFVRNNPDIQKYEFTRSYIAALTHIKSVKNRWEKASPKDEYKGASDRTLMHGYLALIIKDNADLRIAKNYIKPYLESANPLIRKTADTFILGCINVIAVNEKEKQIWDQWNGVKSSGLGNRANEKAFLEAQEKLANKRLDAFKLIIGATKLTSKVMLSAKNQDDKGRLLAITKDQRRRLLKSLDELDSKSLDWGLKSGQNYHSASIAILREVLEDPLYKTLP